MSIYRLTKGDRYVTFEPDGDHVTVVAESNVTIRIPTHVLDHPHRQWLPIEDARERWKALLRLGYKPE